MKYAIVFIFCLIAVVKAGKEFSNEFKEKLIGKMQEIGAKCAADENANGDDIGQLLSRQVPTRKEGKCLIACVNQAFGTQDASGKFTRDGAIKALQPFKEENEGIFNKLIELMDECLPHVKSADRCEAAGEMNKCMNENADKKGLKPDLFM